MDLSAFYPLPRDLIQNEIRVLNYLASNSYIAAEHPEFFADVMKYRAQYQGTRTGFQFASYLNVFHKEMPRLRKRSSRHPRKEPNLQLIVGGLIEQRAKSKYGNISYVLGVGRIRAKHPAILRKFHFDVTGQIGTRQVRRQEHPMCHLQYCGGILPLMKELGFRQSQFEHLHERLSEPRIFFWPMSLALLIDMALHEFPDSKSAQFRRGPEWQSIIRENERLLLRPFYERCVKVIKDAAKEKKTLADEFYVT